MIISRAKMFEGNYIKAYILRFGPHLFAHWPPCLLLKLVKRIPRFAYFLPNTLSTTLPNYLNEFQIHIDTKYPIEKKLLTGMYDKVVTKTILEEVRADDVCLDIGANIGAMTMAMLKSKASKVIAFEPGPEINARFMANVALNPHIAHKVTLIPKGLDEKKGILYWNNQPKYNMGNATLNGVDLSGDDIKVEVTTLDEELGDVKIDFIKVDVEGMEYRVLAGGMNLLSKYHPKILFETNIGHGDQNLKDLNEMLVDLGYQIYNLTSEAKTPTSYPDFGFNCLAIHHSKPSLNRG